MLTWLNAHAGLALWLGALGAVAFAACAATALAWTVRRRRRADIACLCAARGPVRSLCESTRMLRELAEGSEGVPRILEAAALLDGTLAQRIRDVRALPVADLRTPRAIEAVYQAREAAAQLMVWLEHLKRDPAEVRLRIQTIWKALHDSDGSLERDVSALEAAAGRGRRLS